MRQVCQDHVCLKLLLVRSLVENVTLNMSWAHPEKGLGAYWMNFRAHPIFSYVGLRITELGRNIDFLSLRWLIVK